MNIERKRLLFDLTVWITAPLLVFTLLAVDAHGKSRAAANCAACHPGAAASDFNEHAVRIPRQGRE